VNGYLLQNDQSFNQELRGVGDSMCNLLTCLKDLHNVIKIISLKYTIEEIMKRVLEAASFIDKYLKGNAIEKVVSVQFGSKLDDYQSLFSSLNNQ